MATCKNVNDFGNRHAGDFTPDSIGGQQFAIISAAVTQEGNLGAQQRSGKAQKTSGVRSRGIAFAQIHDDMLAINRAAHALKLLGTAGIDGKFQMPHDHGEQALLSAARAFRADALPLTPLFISMGLHKDFLAQIDSHIADLEAAISVKGAGGDSQAAATGGLGDTTQRTAVALHVLDTVVRNKYRNDPQTLAEWAVASHVERHTPTPRAQPVPATA